MDITILKKIAGLSLILGAVLGAISIIPYVNFFSLMCLIFVCSPIVIIYMKRNDLIGMITLRQGVMYGSIIGFITFAGFMVMFIPLSALIGIFYKEGIYLAVNMFFKAGGIMVLFLILIMAGMLNALFNAFSGAFTAYFYEQKEKQIQKEHESFEIES